MSKHRLCTFGGCNRVAVDNTSRCDQHPYTHTPKKVYHDHHFHKARYFYGTSQWQRLRESYINQHPLCEHCERRGLITPAQEVDHIVELIDGGDKLSWDNLQSLCTTCHRIKTGEEKRKRNERKKLNGFNSLSDF